MTALLLTPTVLSLVLLAAHFGRAGQPWLLVLSLVLALLVLVPRRWAAWLLQTALLLGAAEWLRTTLVIAMTRQAMGVPTTRLVVILGTVALTALAAAALYRTPRLRRRFQ